MGNEISQQMEYTSYEEKIKTKYKKFIAYLTFLLDNSCSQSSELEKLYIKLE